MTPATPWNPNFPNTSPLFAPIKTHFGANIQHWQHWPTTEALNTLLTNIHPPIQTQSGAPLQFVPAPNKQPQTFADHYEPRIYLTGQVPTRTDGWHDFFGALCWMLFPQTKAALNALHFKAASTQITDPNKQKQRTPIENAATLFDESGAVVLSSDPELLTMIKQMQWKDLFWQQRERARNNLRVVIFGHGLYEKALRPYIGLTAQTVLLAVKEQELADCHGAKLDRLIADWWSPDRTPRDLVPLPILGMPGVTAENDIEAYYDNANYFRTKRR